MNKELQYQFNLARLVTIEYALIDKNFKEGKEVNINTGFNFAALEEHKLIAVGTRFQYEIDKQPFIIINVEGQFIVTEETWSSLIQEDGKTLIIPKPFMAHLTMLVVGSTRGVLHAKLENTRFNQFVLPTINVQAIIKEDPKITLSETT